jgi:DNA-binding beta-propeller fold protein YncE
MNRTRILAAVAAAVALVAMPTTKIAVVAQAQPNGPVPRFEYDPSWPKPFPTETWTIGAIGGMAVDRQDHIWVVQRPGPLRTDDRFNAAGATPPRAECCVPAPPVLQFDQNGTLITAWGGAGEGYEWPQVEHGIFVDHQDMVWLAGSGAKDSQLLKFTRDGKFVKQFGRQGKSGGNADTQNAGGPANLFVDQPSNEVYVADGYRNRRVLVLDADTFAFKRMWGAYGNRPEDADIGPYDPDAPPARQFRTPHNVVVSKDGFVYVADRVNDRVQAFRKDGTFVREGFISRRTLLAGAASGLALSADPQQRFLYVIDGANHRIWILLRDTLQAVGRFGQQGLSGGAMNVPHALAVDSRGNIYIGENFDARRVQRFLYKGMGSPTSAEGVIPPARAVQ